MTRENNMQIDVITHNISVYFQYFMESRHRPKINVFYRIRARRVIIIH